jgi:hypothetical protein
MNRSRAVLNGEDICYKETGSTPPGILLTDKGELFKYASSTFLNVLYKEKDFAYRSLQSISLFVSASSASSPENANILRM